MDIEYIPLDQITIDQSLQTRMWTDAKTVSEYASLMADGVEFEPIDLIHDGNKYYIVDGNHRVLAAKKQHFETIQARVQSGTRRDALFGALAANARHGLSLNNDDKHKIVMTILLDPEWSEMSDRQIVKHVGAVSQPFVSSRRKAIELIQQDEPPLTNDEILERKGSYKINLPLIEDVRKKLNIPEPVLRKFPVGSYIRFSPKSGWEQYHGVVISHTKQGQLQVRSWGRNDNEDTRIVNPAKASYVSHNEYVYTWRCITRKSPETLLMIPWDDHYITFDWNIDINRCRFGYKTKEAHSSGLACRVSQEYVDLHHEVIQIVPFDDLDETMQDAVSRAGRTRDKKILYPEQQAQSSQEPQPEQQPKPKTGKPSASDIATYESSGVLRAIKPEYKLADYDPDLGMLGFYGDAHRGHIFGTQYMLFARLGDQFLCRNQTAGTIFMEPGVSAMATAPVHVGGTLFIDGVDNLKAILGRLGRIGLYYPIGGIEATNEFRQLRRSAMAVSEFFEGSDNGYHQPDTYEDDRPALTLPFANETYERMWLDVMAYLTDRDWFDNQQLDETAKHIAKMLELIVDDWKETKKLSQQYLEKEA